MDDSIDRSLIIWWTGLLGVLGVLGDLGVLGVLVVVGDSMSTAGDPSSVNSGTSVSG